MRRLRFLYEQSVDIAQGVVSTGYKGARDHGCLCGETPELMPGATYYAHGVLKGGTPSRLESLREIIVDT
jgi:S-adenosylmethionine synthetase